MEKNRSTHNEDFPYDDDLYHTHGDRLEHFAEKAGNYVSWTDGKIRGFIMDYPITVALATLGVGFVVGRILSRR